MFNWKLTRKQKLLRNIAATLAALVSLWWMLDFPVLTTESLLRRAEQAYLLDEQGEILYTYSWLDNGRTLSRHGDRLMSINWERTLLGRRFLGAKLFDPEVRHILFYHTEGVKEAGMTYWQPQPELWGLVEDAASAELEWTVVTKDGAQMTWTMPGVRKDDHYLSFSFQRNYVPGTNSEEAAIEERLLLGDYVREEYSALIRFYDAEGMLTETHLFEDVGYGYNISTGGEEP